MQREFQSADVARAAVRMALSETRADENELKEKPSPTNWKKYISFAFGGTSKNKQEEKQAEQLIQEG